MLVSSREGPPSQGRIPGLAGADVVSTHLWGRLPDMSERTAGWQVSMSPERGPHLQVAFGAKVDQEPPLAKHSAPEELASSLGRRMWITKGARFNAARRLRACYRLSLLSVSVTAACVLFLSIAQALLPASVDARPLVLAAIAISLAALVFSLLEVSQRYEARAAALHSSACEIDRLLGRLKLAQSGGLELESKVLLEISDAYHQAIGRYADNHEPIDNWLVRVNDDPTNSAPAKFLAGVWHKLSATAIYYIACATAIGTTAWLVLTVRA